MAEGGEDYTSSQRSVNALRTFSRLLDVARYE
jgi:hypothetical protein